MIYIYISKQEDSSNEINFVFLFFIFLNFSHAPTMDFSFCLLKKKSQTNPRSIFSRGFRVYKVLFLSFFLFECAGKKIFSDGLEYKMNGIVIAKKKGEKK